MPLQIYHLIAHVILVHLFLHIFISMLIRMVILTPAAFFSLITFALLFCLIDARFVFYLVYLSFSSFSTSCSSSPELVFCLSILSLRALVDFVFILSLCFPNLDRFIPFFSLRSCLVLCAQQLTRSFSFSYYCRLRVTAFCIPCGSMRSAAMCLWSGPVAAPSGHSLLHMITWSIFKIGSSMAASVSVAFHGCSWMFFMAKSLDLLCLASLKENMFGFCLRAS